MEALASQSADAALLTSAGQLEHELQLLELRLRREVLITRAERGGARGFDEFSGLYIADEEIDTYMQDELQDRSRPCSAGAVLLEQRLAAEQSAQDACVEQARAAGAFLRLERVREAFSLSPAEYGMLVACLAPDLDLRFERYYAYLQNEVSRRRPCVQLLGRMFLGEACDAATLRALFASDESLVGARLVELYRPAADAGFVACQPRAREGLLNFVLEVDGTDPDLQGLGTWRQGRAEASEAQYFEQHKGVVRGLLEYATRERRLPYVFLRGPEGCAKQDLVLALAHGLSAQVLEWEAESLLVFEGDWNEQLRLTDRDLRLRSAFLWIRHAEALLGLGENQRARLKSLGQFLRERPTVNLVLSGEKGPAELRGVLGVNLLECELAWPDLSQRSELWRSAAGEIGSSRPAELWDGLSAKFQFGPEKIQATLQTLRSQPGDGLDGQAWDEALHRACRAESGQGLAAFARRLPPKYVWADLVLPEDLLDQLREVRNCVRYRRRVYGDWGFDHKFSLGRGLNLLFSGPSGTGKTMSAEILAGDLGLELYQIDLSSVVSKYIGETEKNLARVFKEAQSANCILLFDEADALFGKRSEVKDSHDRYANIEINYLLQRMDDYEGIVILTTNMLKNLDPAFTRRIHYTVEFPLPDERQRERMWSRVFPADTPRADDLDLPFLARRFKLTGATVKNVALNSAFLAAADGGIVNMEHLMVAMKREYRKMGKLCSRSEFGPYYTLVRDEEPAPAEAAP